MCGGIDIKESWKILWQKGIQIDVVHSTDNIKSIVIRHYVRLQDLAGFEFIDSPSRFRFFSNHCAT